MICDTPELWTMVGSHFRFPISVQWHDALAAVDVFPLNYLNVQRKKFMEFLDRIGEFRDGKWWILREKLEATAYAEVGEVDPETCVMWTPPTVDHKTLTASAKVKEFVADVCSQGLNMDREKTEVLWQLFCRTMLDWLLNKQRSVPLYFANLHAFPMRSNWQSHAMARTNERLKIHKNYQIPVEAEVLAPIFTAYETKQKIALWTIDVELLPTWYKNVIRLEREKRKQKDALGYVKSTLDTLERLRFGIKAVYRSFCRQTFHHPVFLRAWEHECHARFVVRLKASRPRFKLGERFPPFWPKGVSRRAYQIVWKDGDYALVRREGGRRRRPRIFRPYREKKSSLSAMSRLQQRTDDVRNIGKSISGSGNKADEACRLPVLFAVQESAQS